MDMFKYFISTACTSPLKLIEIVSSFISLSLGFSGGIFLNFAIFHCEILKTVSPQIVCPIGNT